MNEMLRKKGVDGSRLAMNSMAWFTTQKECICSSGKMWGRPTQPLEERPWAMPGSTSVRPWRSRSQSM